MPSGARTGRRSPCCAADGRPSSAAETNRPDASGRDAPWSGSAVVTPADTIACAAARAARLPKAGSSSQRPTAYAPRNAAQFATGRRADRDVVHDAGPEDGDPTTTSLAKIVLLETITQCQLTARSARRRATIATGWLPDNESVTSGNGPIRLAARRRGACQARAGVLLGKGQAPSSAPERTSMSGNDLMREHPRLDRGRGDSAARTAHRAGRFCGVPPVAQPSSRHAMARHPPSPQPRRAPPGPGCRTRLRTRPRPRRPSAWCTCVMRGPARWTTGKDQPHPAPRSRTWPPKQPVRPGDRRNPLCRLFSYSLFVR